jgi:hypothetical protein
MIDDLLQIASSPGSAWRKPWLTYDGIVRDLPTTTPSVRTLSTLLVLVLLGGGCETDLPSDAGSLDAGGPDVATPAPPDDAAGAPVDAPATLDAAPVDGAPGLDAPASASPSQDARPAAGACVVPPRPMVDLLFVIDNSPYMEQKQRSLARAMPRLFEELARLPGGAPDLHIGVVSSDVGAGPTPLGNCVRPGGDRGRLQVRPGCGVPDGGSPFLRLHAGGAPANFKGSPAETLGCLVQLGELGCGYEHTLQSARVALAGPHQGGPDENQGFLRPEAHLALVILSDEDDCSAEPRSPLFADDTSFEGQSSSLRCSLRGHVCGGQDISTVNLDPWPLQSCAARPDGGGLIPVGELAAFFKRLKAQSGSVSVTVIAGWDDSPSASYRLQRIHTGDLTSAPICATSNNVVAYAGLRLREFAGAFGAAGRFLSICLDDLSPVWTAVRENIAGGLTCRSP